MKKLVLSAVFALSLCFAAKAQEETVDENPAEVKDSKVLTAEELKAQRAILVALSKSEEYLSKIEKAENAKIPSATGIDGVDALNEIVAKLMAQLKQNRNAIPNMYASITGQNIDGSVATGVTKLNPDELAGFAKMLVTMGTELVKSSKSLLTLPADIKAAGVMKGLKALKSVVYIKNAISALKQEISYNSKMVKNLVATNHANLAATNVK